MPSGFNFSVRPRRGRNVRPAPGLGATLRALREQRGLSVAALARSCGVHPNRVGEIERGQWHPPPEIISRLAQRLCVAIEVLVPQ